MTRVDIKLGYSCNDACVHCVVDDFRDALRSSGMRQDKTTEQYRRELSESRVRADQVVITGGEPTIRSDLVELLAYAHDLGYHIMIQSNGRRFSDAAFADLVTGTAPIAYCIALHGPTPTIHDAITRRPGSFDETVAGFRNLIARRQKIMAKVVISQFNYRVLRDTIRFLLDLGVPNVSIAFPHAQGTARKMWEAVVPRYRDVVPFLHQALDEIVQARVDADAETFMYCHMEGYERFISENSQQLEEYAELRQYGGNVEIQDWSRVRLQIKEKFPQCGSCRFNPVCEGPWDEYAHRYGGEEFTPVPGRRVQHVREILDGSFRREFPHLETWPVALC